MLDCSIQGLKKGLVVAKKLVVNDFWLVVNGDWASCKSQAKIASCTMATMHRKV